MGRQLHRLSRGVDARSVIPHEPARSVSAETTFDEDVDDPVVLHRILLGLSERVGHRLRKAGLAGRTISIKVRFASFDTISRSVTMDQPTDRTHDLIAHAGELFDSLRLERARVRLLGVGVSNLAEGSAARQLALDVDPRWEEVDQVADAVRERFGNVRVSFAALLDDDFDETSETGEDRRL
jgi:DNA polymerase-4